MTPRLHTSAALPEISGLTYAGQPCLSDSESSRPASMDPMPRIQPGGGASGHPWWKCRAHERVHVAVAPREERVGARLAQQHLQHLVDVRVAAQREVGRQGLLVPADLKHLGDVVPLQGLEQQVVPDPGDAVLRGGVRGRGSGVGVTVGVGVSGGLGEEDPRLGLKLVWLDSVVLRHDRQAGRQDPRFPRFSSDDASSSSSSSSSSSFYYSSSSTWSSAAAAAAANVPASAAAAAAGGGGRLTDH
ncbi:hypothetical protein CRUP_007433 [Coryphaenoides rupestris]|nr:hypothetical protein CRUP_007433 [Coryphaenoides rupestris]